MPLNPTIADVCDFIKSYFIDQSLNIGDITRDQKLQLDSLTDLALTIQFDQSSGKETNLAKMNKLSQLINLQVHILTSTPTDNMEPLEENPGPMIQMSASELQNCILSSICEVDESPDGKLPEIKDLLRISQVQEKIMR
jgi:hypothetical protein